MERRRSQAAPWRAHRFVALALGLALVACGHRASATGEPDAASVDASTRVDAAVTRADAAVTRTDAATTRTDAASMRSDAATDARTLTRLAVAGDAAPDDAATSTAAPITPEDDSLALPPLTESPEPAVVDAPPSPPPPVAAEDRPAALIKTILGLVALLVLAYVGGHPRVQRVERSLGLSQVITAGFPFVALGVVARLPTVGVLTDPVLAQLGPLLRFGLGWIGFIIGFRFDARLIEAAPKGVSSLVATRALTTFAVIVLACTLLLLGGSRSWQAALTNPVFLRDALILGTAGSLTSLTTPRLLANRGGPLASVTLVSHVVRLQELAGIVGLLFIAAYFRPGGSQVTWQLPSTAWLLLTLGLGAAMGIVVYAILLRSTRNRSESMVLLLGSVAFAAGMAAHLRLSPVVVCFVAGMLLANFPGHYRAQMEATLSHLERPIYLLFLVVVGALWRVRDWRGWVLMGAFVAARFVGKWIGTRLGAAQSGLKLAPEVRGALVVAPMGALSIAIVVDAQLLYPGGSIPRIVTAVVGGAIVTEMIVQLLSRAYGPVTSLEPTGRFATSSPAPSAEPVAPREPTEPPPSGGAA